MNEKIENLLKEDRKFPPSEHLVKNANAPSSWYDEANEDRLKFWQKQALSRISWFKEPTEILDDANPPFFKWFKDGELNLSYNCLDRHLESDGDRVAFYWEGEPGDTQEISYQDLYERVCKLSNALKKLGVEKGDRVAIYLGMTPEIVVSMLACARMEPCTQLSLVDFHLKLLQTESMTQKQKQLLLLMVHGEGEILFL